MNTEKLKLIIWCYTGIQASTKEVNEIINNIEENPTVPLDEIIFGYYRAIL